MKLDYNVDDPRESDQAERGKWGQILLEFLSSKRDVAKVCVDTNISLQGARSSAAAIIKRYGLPVTVSIRSGGLYFFRLEETPDAVRP